MRKIKISFSDFWDSFDKNDNYFIEILKKNYNVEITENTCDTEYLFYSCFGYEHLKYDCVKIFYTGENLVPDFNLCDYAIGFEHMEYGDRYIRMPLYMVDFRKDYKHMLDIRGNIYPRDKFCSFVASNNAEADTARKDIFDKLSEYRTVDSGGRYLNNIGQPNGVADKQAFQEQYKFSMAIENSSHPGYCTEKIIQSFAAGTIPIYWGDPNVGEYFNEKAFINCHGYKDLDEMINAVKRVDNDIDLYNIMINEPIITDNNQKIEAYDKAFERWICNIIEQTINKAYRRSLHGKEQVYKAQINRWIDYEGKYSEFERKSMIKKIANIVLKR